MVDEMTCSADQKLFPVPTKTGMPQSLGIGRIKTLREKQNNNNRALIEEIKVCKGLPMEDLTLD